MSPRSHRLSSDVRIRALPERPKSQHLIKETVISNAAQPLLVKYVETNSNFT